MGDRRAVASTLACAICGADVGDEDDLGYINQINVLIKQMTTNNYKFKPTWAIHFILRGLPPLYSTIATIIHTQAIVTLNFTQSTLHQHKSSIINKTTMADTSHYSLLFTTQLTAQPSSTTVTHPNQGTNTPSAGNRPKRKE